MGEFMVRNDEEGNRNGAIGVDRIMDLLVALQQRPSGLSLKELLEQTGQAKTTAYRLLNSLERHGMVRAAQSGRYVLGGRLLELAGAVIAQPWLTGWLHQIQPQLDAMAVELGETHKISVYDRGVITLVAGASGRSAHALSYTIGESLPLHAGAASKVLMAGLSEEERRAVLPLNFALMTDKTIAERAAFEEELARVRAQGWAHDPGEFSPSVLAYAAPVLSRSGRTIAALSATFLPQNSQSDLIRTRVMAHAARLADMLPLDAV